MLSTKTRPVFCFCCEKPLYYFGDPQHAPEFVLDIKDPTQPIKVGTESVKHFVHQTCWTKFLTDKTEIFKDW
jgi:hypothetical protein